MIGRTNIPFGVTGAVDGVTVADLPTHLSSLTAAANSGRVILTLGYSDTDFVSGVDVLYKTGSFPTSPTDGECVSSSGAVTEITIEGLTNAVKYFFRTYLYRLIGGVKYYQTDETNAKIYATPSAVGVIGIEPAIVGENYLIIDQSGTFSLDVPEEISDITVYVVGGGYNGSDGTGRPSGYGSDTNCGDGGSGGAGGYVHSFALSDAYYADTFTSAIGAVGGGNTTLQSTNMAVVNASSGSRVYGGNGVGVGAVNDSNNSKYNGKNGVLTPYGYVGSSGGGGGGGHDDWDDESEEDYGNSPGGTGGVGAGDGGEGGGTGCGSGANGEAATNYGCGGGGGGGSDTSSSARAGKGGKGMQGCIIIEWA